MSILALPGDHIPIPSTSSIKLGPGLALSSDVEGHEEELVAVAPGILGQLRSTGKGKSKSANNEDSQVLWVESNSNRYYPTLNDHVLCQITNRGVDAYQVTLFNTFTNANLPALSFEGATKRNKPNLRIGTLLYAQIVSAQRHAEIELTCVDQSTGKYNGFGELKTEREEVNVNSTTTTKTTKSKSNHSISSSAANLFPISCGLARSLLNEKHSLLSRLAKHFPFEVAIGVNGMVWVKAEEVKHVIAVGKVLEQADSKALYSPTTITQQEGEGNTALEIVKQRGGLSVEEIARIVEPFK